MAICANSAAVIPCRDEERTIGPLIRGVRAHLNCVIVVDDGSEDDTAAAAIGAGATLIRRQRSGGKGSALAAGFREAAELGCAWALAMDGDGQHAAADIPSFFSRAEASDARMI